MCDKPEDCQYFGALMDSCKRVSELETKLALEREKVDSAEASGEEAKAALAEAEAEYERRRGVMNELFAAGVAMRKAQTVYFRERTQAALAASKAAENRFDAALQACRNVGKGVQQLLGA